MFAKPYCYLIVMISLYFLSPVHVRSNERMSDEQMQQMMEQAEKMGQCMQGIDESAINELAAMSEKMQAEIKELCEAGNRKEAEKRAIKLGTEIANSRQMKELQKCGAMARQMMHNMPSVTENMEKNNSHVCDQYQ